LAVDLQLEIIALQCDSDLKTKFALASFDTFYQYLFPGYVKVTALLCMFGTTHLCEQVFSMMNINKAKLCSRLTHAHLNDILKVAATEDLTPDIDTLMQWFPNWGKLSPGVICDSLRGNAGPNHIVFLYYERSLQKKFLTRNVKIFYWWVIRHNRYLDLGNGSNKFGNHCTSES